VNGRHETCPICKNFILSERIEKHITDHKAEAEEALQEALANPYPSSSSFLEKQGPNLDATKDMCYPAREQGKYGSHSSHDGFDDESVS
jgi:hypothetical protein